MNLSNIETIADLIASLARAGKAFDCPNVKLKEACANIEEDIRVQVELLTKELQ